MSVLDHWWCEGERVTGTDDWVEVALLRNGAGYDWSEFNAFYSPSARRYFWHGDGGCSCNMWIDGVDNADDFENGDRAALIRAWQAFSKDGGYPGAADYIDGLAEIKRFEEP